MEILQVVGYRNSGKTTTANAIIEYLSRAGVLVASLKHHGHGSFPDGLDMKDSMLHQEAGAVVSGVEGAGLLQLGKKQSWDLEQIIQIYELFEVELLLIEGYKKQDYPKIVLIHEETDRKVLSETSNIVAVVSDLSLESAELKFPVFQRNELNKLCKWVLDEQIHKVN